MTAAQAWQAIVPYRSAGPARDGRGPPSSPGNGPGAIISLRCREASSTREAICNSPRTQTRTA